MAREHTARIPLACPYVTDKTVDHHILCALHNTWVDCQTSHWGEFPMCAYEEPDNSDAATRARLEWLAARKEVRDGTKDIRDP